MLRLRDRETIKVLGQAVRDQFDNSNMFCLCYDSSLILANLLHCAGFDAYVILGLYRFPGSDYDGGDPHAWVEITDPDDKITWIVDITRTQFVADSDSVFIQALVRLIGYLHVNISFTRT